MRLGQRLGQYEVEKRRIWRPGDVVLLIDAFGRGKTFTGAGYARLCAVDVEKSLSVSNNFATRGDFGHGPSSRTRHSKRRHHTDTPA